MMAGLEKLDQTLSDTVGQITQFIQAHGEEGVGLLGTVYQMKAISNLIQIVPAAVLLGVVLYWGPRWLRRAIEIGVRNDDDPEIIPYLVGCIAAGVSGLIACIWLTMAINAFFDPVNWAAALNWKVAIAAHILKAL